MCIFATELLITDNMGKIELMAQLWFMVKV